MLMIRAISENVTAKSADYFSDSNKYLQVHAISYM